MADVLPINIIVGAAEIPLLFILLVLGIAAYFKNKSITVKYTIIIFPVIVFLNFLALIVGEIFRTNDTVLNLLEPANKILTIVVFIGCLVALEMAVRWYLDGRGPVALCLLISFGLYALSSLLIFLDTNFVIYKDAGIRLAALISGLAAYLAGISAMVMALVQPKQQQSKISQI
jgi:hypothetical protein